MTSHDRFGEDVAAYALRALDAAERSAFERHLEGCAQCQQQLLELERVTTALGLAAGPVEPPASLRARTLARATSQSQAHAASISPDTARPADELGRRASSGTPARFTSRSWLPLAAAIVVCAGLLVYIAVLHAQIRTLQQTVADAAARADTLRADLVDLRQQSVHALGVLSAPDLVRIDLRGRPADSPALGRVFMSPARGVLLSVEHLPALPGDRIYQVWAVPAGALPPVSVGVFNVDATGTSSIPLVAPASLTNVQAIGVTVEPAGGSARPTSPPVLAGTLAG